MPKTLMLFSLLFLGAGLSGQSGLDAVYLENGSIYRGKIIEHDSTQLKIEIIGGSVFVLPISQVTEIQQEKNNRFVNNTKQKGYINFTSLGVLVGSSTDNKTSPFSGIIDNNYRFSNWFACGLRTGIELINENVIPVAANIKIFVPGSTGRLFFSSSGGYCFPLNKPEEYGVDKMYGGPLLENEFGVIIPVSVGNAVYFAAGYRYTVLKYRYANWWTNDVDRRIYYSRLSLRLGILLY